MTLTQQDDSYLMSKLAQSVTAGLSLVLAYGHLDVTNVTVEVVRVRQERCHQLLETVDADVTRRLDATHSDVPHGLREVWPAAQRAVSAAKYSR